MSSFGSTSGDVCYLVVCGVPGAERTLDRIRSEQDAGWQVCLIATAKALHWFDTFEAERLTGHTIQSRMRVFGEPLFEPLGDRIVVAPASFNTINRIALGLADDMPAGLVCEAIGRQVPITIEPQLGPAFANHPAFASSVEILQNAGCTFVWNDPSIRPGEAR